MMVSHHALYQAVHGQPANSPVIQLWVIRAGTALAFLSKLCLAVATGVAYDQWMWVNLQARSHEIGTLDTMFAVLANAFEFLSLRVWARRPLLTFLAAVTW